MDFFLYDLAIISDYSYFDVVTARPMRPSVDHRWRERQGRTRSQSETSASEEWLAWKLCFRKEVSVCAPATM